jgi:hypothetical protein
MRGAAGRARRISGRRQRSPIVSTTVDTSSDDDASPDAGAAQDDQDLEKIEVHVHVHRGQGSDGNAARKKRRPPRLSLTGSLSDWQGHYERLYKDVPAAPPALEPSPLGSKCHACGGAVGVMAKSCPSCEAAQPRGLLGKVAVAIGLGSFIGMFGLLLHLSGSSVKEHRPPEPLRPWEEEPWIVAVPMAPSPFSYTSNENGPMPFNHHSD